jgi:hypothetical protein
LECCGWLIVVALNEKTINDIGRGISADANEDGCQFNYAWLQLVLGLILV